MESRFHIGAAEWPGISKLIEESGEVQQVCGKLIASEGKKEHWDGTDLKCRLEEELGDLLAAIDFVMTECGLSDDRILFRCQEKTALFRKWHDGH